MQPRKSDTLSIRRVSVPAGLSRSSRYPPRCILPSAALSSPIYAPRKKGTDRRSRRVDLEGWRRVLRLRMMILESFGFLGREKLVEETKIFFFNRDLDRENARTRTRA